MQTVYDWASVLLFCAIALTFLHRSLAPVPVRPDPMIAYLPPVLGCALANWLGNSGAAAPAVLALCASAAYYIWVLRPQSDFR